MQTIYCMKYSKRVKYENDSGDVVLDAVATPENGSMTCVNGRWMLSTDEAKHIDRINQYQYERVFIFWRDSNRKILTISFEK